MFIPILDPDPSFQKTIQQIPPAMLREVFCTCIHVLEHLANRRSGFAMHPCVQMWRPYPLHLLNYARDLDARITKEFEPRDLGPDLQRAADALNEYISPAYTGPEFKSAAEGGPPSNDVRIPPHWLVLVPIDPASPNPIPNHDCTSEAFLLISSHRSRLLTNHPEACKNFGWTEPHHVSLFWPGPPPSARPTPLVAPNPKGHAELLRTHASTGPKPSPTTKPPTKAKRPILNFPPPSAPNPSPKPNNPEPL